MHYHKTAVPVSLINIVFSFFLKTRQAWFTIFLFVLLAIPAIPQTNQLDEAVKLYRSGNFEAAGKILESLIASGKGTKEIYSAAAECAIQGKKFDKAAALLEKSLSLYGPDYSNTLLLAQLYAQGGKTDKAAGMLKKMLAEHPDSSSLKLLLAKIYAAEGGDFYQDKKYDQAANAFKLSLSYDRLHKDSRNNLLVTLIQLQKYEEALPYAKDAFSLFPSEKKFGDIYIELLILTENYAEALKMSKKSSDAYPDDLQAKLRVALLYRYNQMLEEARNLYAELRARYPKSREVYDEEIKWLQLYAPADTIIARQREYLKNNPGDLGMMMAMAKQYESRNSFDTARTIYREIESMDLNREAPLLIADTYIREGNKELAIAELRQYIMSGGRAESAYLNISSLLLETGKPEESKIFLQRGIAANAGNIDFSLALAKIYFSETNYDSVLYVLEPIKASYSEQPEIAYYFARVFQEQNDTSRAKFHYLRFIRSSLKQTGILQAQILGSISGDNLSNPDSLSNAQASAEQLSSLTNLLKDGFARLKALSSTEDYLTELNELIQLLPSAAVTYLLRARYYDEQGMFEKAKEDFQTAVLRSPYIEDVLLEAGEFFARQEMYQEAYDLFNNAIKANKTSAAAYTNVIEMAYRLGRLNEVCDYWLRVYQADTRNKFLREYLIQALHKAGRYSDAEPIINEKED